MSTFNFREKIVISKSAKGTAALGKRAAERLVKQCPRDGAFVLALRGGLGSGKTTFLQGFAKGLGIKEKIISPTFVLMKKFSIPNYQLLTANCKFFYHIDCYRLGKPEEILALGWPEIIANPKNIVAVEWPEKIKKFLPEETIFLNFKFVNKNERNIEIT